MSDFSLRDMIPTVTVREVWNRTRTAKDRLETACNEASEKGILHRGNNKTPCVQLQKRRIGNATKYGNARFLAIYPQCICTWMDGCMEDGREGVHVCASFRAYLESVCTLEDEWIG